MAKGTSSLVRYSGQDTRPPNGLCQGSQMVWPLLVRSEGRAGTGGGVEFSKRSIVVGPNDAGKSNIFRVLLLLCNLLPPKSRALQASDVYSDEASASIDAELILSEEETSILIDYLGFYKVKLEGSNTEEMRVSFFHQSTSPLHFITVHSAQCWLATEFSEQFSCDNRHRI